MNLKFFVLYYLISLLMILYFIKIIRCSNNTWNYDKCKQYLNTLNIICTKIDETKIYTLCEKWKTKKPSVINNIPKYCQNKKYILTLLISTFNPPIKAYSIIDIKKQNKEIEKYEKDEEIEQCFELFDNFEKKYLLNFTEIKDQKRILMEYKDKLNMSNFCIDFSLNIIIHLINNYKSNYNKSYNKEIAHNQYTDFDDEDNDFKEENNYFESSETNEKSNQANENESDKNSQKDCVEYGLKSDKEEILVCKKHE